MWFGISAGMHAFPGNHDMDGFVEYVREDGHCGPLLWLAHGFAVLLKIANFLRAVWFDAIYAVLVAAFLPLMFGLYQGRKRTLTGIPEFICFSSSEKERGRHGRRYGFRI